MGGGGLLAGALAATERTNTRVVGVEPETACCLGAALEAGSRIRVDVAGAAVDSLGPTRVGRHAFEAALRHRPTLVRVKDSDIATSQRVAWNELRIGLEGGGATALAAILSGAYTPGPEEMVGVVASGGNVDVTLLG